MVIKKKEEKCEQSFGKTDTVWMIMALKIIKDLIQNLNTF